METHMCRNCYSVSLVLYFSKEAAIIYLYRLRRQPSPLFISGLKVPYHNLGF